MSTLLLTINNLLPLYLLILIGFFASKYLQTCKQSISKILIYILTPAVVFQGISSVESNLSLSIIFFIICSTISIITFKISKNNLLSFSSGTGNVGYFGLPVILTIFGDQAFNIAILCTSGFVLYENTIGYIIATNTKATFKMIFYKLSRHPFIYAFLIGLLLNLTKTSIPVMFAPVFSNLKATYSILGMMLIGIGLSNINNIKINLQYIKQSLLIKFVIWPIITLILIYIDKNLLHAWNQSIYQIILILSVCPVAANTVAFAALAKQNTNTVATTVILSTIISLIIIPITTTIL